MDDENIQSRIEIWRRRVEQLRAELRSGEGDFAREPIQTAIDAYERLIVALKTKRDARSKS